MRATVITCWNPVREGGRVLLVSVDNMTVLRAADVLAGSAPVARPSDAALMAAPDGHRHVSGEARRVPALPSASVGRLRLDVRSKSLLFVRRGVLGRPQRTAWRGRTVGDGLSMDAMELRTEESANAARVAWAGICRGAALRLFRIR
jgi:hypothetical protein